MRKEKLITGRCTRCGQRLSGDTHFLGYHTYKEHPEAMRNLFEIFYPTIPELTRFLLSKEDIYELIMSTYKHIDEQEKKLI